ncbi:EAL domain-containing protein [Elioraea sp. Yellowstone]|jgi:EAL domain-containing protein (putative c-di-GMP-specific phosphodiesterase class I)|uniref:EAL domain-containing protein n=1 Tax=Elioraea sp. Yellowstone TaxID=2592070 RepID=UPI001386B5BD|nr:EAL domain-containing protein [Elioraea sp. Yellowstone]
MNASTATKPVPGPREMMPAPARPDTRERLLAFAFAPSDLLVEVDENGLITFAAGAFPSRYGLAPAEAVGTAVERLIAPEDRAAMQAGLAHLALKGRLRPVALRLADRQQSICAFAGLAIGNADCQRFCLTFGPLAAPLPETGARASDAEGFGRIAEARLRDAVAAGRPAQLALLEVEGLAEVSVMLGRESREALLDRISSTIADAAPAGTQSELGGGRWALLHGGEANVETICRAVEALLRERAPASSAPRVTGTELRLAAPGFSTLQQVRALRLALDRFAAAGRAGLAAAGFAKGFSSFLGTLAGQAESLRSRLQRRGFRLAFQPVVALADRRPHHFEALVRPQSGTGAAETPQSFVTLVEAAGLSAELDLAVTKLASDSILATRSTAVAVNVSGMSIQDPSFRTSLEQALDTAPELRGRLLFELTETAEIDDLSAARAAIEALRGRGFAVCLDDFGAGAASLRQIKQFEVDYAKIDGSYMRGAETHPRDRELLAQMADLCRAVGARVIAEQIETEAQAAIAIELGIEFGQGSLFGKPGHLPGLVGR